MTDKNRATLFIRTNCKGCAQIDHQVLSALCELETVSCDIDQEYNLAIAIVNDVMSFPTLMMEDGTQYNGADEISEWIKKHQ